jgi:hypothetical protein
MHTCTNVHKRTQPQLKYQIALKKLSMDLQSSLFCFNISDEERMYILKSVIKCFLGKQT